MKIKLFFWLSIISFSVFSQIPNDELAKYTFRNGSLQNETTPGVEDLTQNGSDLSIENDRFDNSQQSVYLFSDYLSRGNFSFGDMSLSFWVKTATNDTNLRTIFDKSFKTGSDFTNETGFFVYLKDGKVGIKGGYVQSNAPGGAHARNEFDFAYSGVIADNNWHHVVITIDREYPEIGNYANPHYQLTYTVKFHVDTYEESYVKSNSTSFSVPNSINANTSFVVNNNSNGALAGANFYKEFIDDIYIFDRVLSANEVLSLGEHQNYCFAPQVSDFSIDNITGTTAEVILSETNTYDFAYVEDGQPFNSATIISNVSGASGILPGLDPNTMYQVYVRTHCGAGIKSNWSHANAFTTSGAITYVDPAATGGANNGTSWADAYTDLHTALSSFSSGEIWVKQGVYTPHASDDTVSFVFSQNNTVLYGGFNGTETSLDQRDLENNPTILSGDLLANDNTDLTSYTNPFRQENSNRVVGVMADNVVINGVIVEGGDSASSGAGIHKHGTADVLTLERVIVRKNIAAGSSAGILSVMNRVGDSLTMINCKVQDNTSTYYAGLYGYFGLSSSSSCNIKIYNTLFENNLIKDKTGRQGASGPAAGFSANNGGAIITRFYNCTFVNNTDLGTLSGVNKGTVVSVKPNSNPGNGAAIYFYNSIFWGNERANNAVLDAHHKSNSYYYTNRFVYNSIDTNDFASFSVGQKTNTSNADPLFTDMGNGDYTLQSTSPAIDGGDNTYTVASITQDLGYNSRIYNSVVDMGIYEADVICKNASNIQVSNLTETSASISWEAEANISNWSLSYVVSGQPLASAVTINNINAASYNLTNLTQFTSYDVYVMSSDCLSNEGFVNSINFTTPGKVFVKADATGANNGSSWADAYTKLEDALLAATPDTPIWVASGMYHPSTSSGDARKASYTIPDGIKMYGGFAGTETLLSERNFRTNLTILSGDLNEDDNATLLHTEPTRQDNAYHVVSIRGNTDNIEIDGFVISGGNANGATNNSCATAAASQSYDTRGGAIYVNPYTSSDVTKALIKNCVLEKNTGTSVAVFSAFSPCGATGVSHEVDFESCTVRDNYSNDLSAFLYSGSSGNAIYSKGSIINSLFYNNVSNSNSGALYLSTSNAAGGNTTGLDVAVINTTFANNTGVNGNVITMVRASNSRIQNSIIYGNGSTTPLAITTSGSSVDNSIIEGGQQAATDADPLFVNPTNSDFTLQAGSPALDYGYNALLPAHITTDLNGNPRIYNSFVDMGCFEHDPTLSIQLQPVVYLQGAFMSPNTGEETLMRDDLRVEGLIPTTSPYSDALTCNSSVFNTTGANAIVDWVWVELRDATDNTIVIEGQSGLLQRDGDVVGVDGVSALTFSQNAGNYNVVVNHRTHLGIITSTPLALSVSASTVDLSSSASSVLGNSNAVIGMGARFAMLAGDFDGNAQVQTSDGNSLLPLIGGAGYSIGDFDMNGQIQTTDLNSVLYPNVGKGQQF